MSVRPSCRPAILRLTLFGGCSVCSRRQLDHTNKGGPMLALTTKQTSISLDRRKMAVGRSFSFTAIVRWQRRIICDSDSVYVCRSGRDER